MKKLMMILFTVSIAAVNTIAQEAPKSPPPHKTPEERAENMTARMTKTLSLNAEQQEKIKAMILKREKDRDALHEKSKENREKMQAEVEADLKKILTPEQFEKFKKNKADMEKKREEKSRKPHAAPADDMAPPPPPAEK